MPARELRAPQRCVATPQGRGNTQKTSSSSEDDWQHQHAPQDRFYAGACPKRGICACRSDTFQRPRKALPNQPGYGRCLAEAVPPAEKGQIDSWDHGVFVASVGSTASCMSLFRGRAPCSSPGNKYVILEQCTWHITNGPVALALQGLGGKEARAFSLHGINDTILRELAGNAFTANDWCAFLVATLLTL